MRFNATTWSRMRRQMHLKILTRRDLETQKGIPWSRQHLDRKIKAGEFPPPFSAPGSSLWLWLEPTIDSYLEAIAAGRDWRETSNPKSAA
jgi:predicted DNA-binding transcriptional regulator AlpA